MRAPALLFCCAALAPVHFPQARADTFPDKPLRFVIPFPPGGGADRLARIVGQKVGDDVGQHVVIDNRGGAGGNIAAEVAARASADGHTLLQANIAHTISRSLYRKLNYDLLRDFSPVTQLASVPFVLLANNGLPASSAAELVALARSRPGELNYASSGKGGPSHMAMELFKAVTGVDARHIPYKGAGPAATDLIGGRVHLMFFTIPAALPHVRSGRLKALYIAHAQRASQLPDVPTAAEAGVPGFEASTWFGVMVPAGTPPRIIAALHRSFTSALAAPEVSQKLAAQGFQPVGSSSREFDAYVKAEVAKWARVVKSSGMALN